jgi:hypothetical protein
MIINAGRYRDGMIFAYSDDAPQQRHRADQACYHFARISSGRNLDPRSSPILMPDRTDFDFTIGVAAA